MGALSRVHQNLAVGTILTAMARLLRPSVEEADLALDVLGARQAQQWAGVAQAQQLQEARLHFTRTQPIGL